MRLNWEKASGARLGRGAPPFGPGRPGSALPLVVPAPAALDGARSPGPCCSRCGEPACNACSAATALTTLDASAAAAAEAAAEAGAEAEVRGGGGDGLDAPVTAP
eukprot:CAMPEP_0118824048 /NCGR_PEP_ID=MMETSP1162-20130426/10324_1 /TAXON_ID=33656 /ORGANISM="Phaeocystis Sp, Strain CCMP2710" /LENGTH=104 /DNA_ID=CAMNT_0006754669 /DNA_START=206 /DNA_END=516 /DNA_ORIENTATION=-